MNIEASPDLIKEILSGTDFAQFIGLAENQYFEAKPAFEYFVQDEEANDNGQVKKDEIAKDVAAFANSKKHGFIICGLTNTKNGKSSLDVVGGVVTGRHTQEHIGRIEGAISEKIYPHPKVSVRTFKNGEDENNLLVIEIPEQEEGCYFFVTEKIPVGGEKYRECYYVPVRSIADTNFKEVAELHRLYREPKSFEVQLQAIQEQISEMRDFIENSQHYQKESVSKGSEKNEFFDRLKEALYGA